MKETKGENREVYDSIAPIIASAIAADHDDRDSRFCRPLIAGSAAASILKHENCEDRTKGSCVHAVGEEYIVYIGTVVVDRRWSSSCADSEACVPRQNRGCVATHLFSS